MSNYIEASTVQMYKIDDVNVVGQLLGQKSNGPGDTKGYNFLIPEPNFKNVISN